MPTLAPLAGSLPYLDEVFTLQLSAIPSGSPAWMLVGLQELNPPTSLTSIGMTGCDLHLVALGAEALGNQGGTANWSLAIPCAGGFAGVRIAVQALLIDPGVNPIGATASAGARLTIGIR